MLGIDELYLNKRYRCILTNIEERTLLDLLATRRQDVVTNYLMKMKDRQKVKIVSMDMWNPYRAAVKAVLPQARIVVDKGTVAKLAMRQPFVLFKGLTFQKLCLPGAFRPGDHHNKMLRPGLCVVHASPQYL
ncbi:TPA: transposase [Escherichia coli]|nr:transposase [Escherichia coli]HAN6006678.1 transposase [Escherichia coli]HAN6015502.1 transposase [Escherichia coli]